MASSDDEVELVAKLVTDYHIVDADEEPISFSVLPIKFDEDDDSTENSEQQQVFLHGWTDGGIQRVYKQVSAWKLRLEEDKEPEVMVLTKDKKWIQLLKPRKSYLGFIRTVMITLQVLHFLKSKPQSSEKSLWDHVRRIFSFFEDRPSEKDLTNHYALINLVMAREDALAKCQMLLKLLKERKKPFNVDYDLKEDVGNDDGDKSDEDLDSFDTVCAICHNGGGLICCEGRCMRTFHATKEDGEDSNCKSLGLTGAQVEAFQKFVCENCKYNQHQCFACGRLGSSDKSTEVEVFPCGNLTCGHFYHPKCVADLLFPGNKAEAVENEKKIAAGKSFTCPAHRCHVCKQEENKRIKELQFAVCRRCPKSYHRKCLPRKIAFKDIEEEGIIQRAWEDLLPNRILIYCLKHKIERELRTPIRNHIIFPEISERKKVTDMQKSKRKVSGKKNRQVLDDFLQEHISVKKLKETEKLSVSEESQPVWKPSKPCEDSSEPHLHKCDGSVPFNYPESTAEREKSKVVIKETPANLTGENILKKQIVLPTHPHTARSIEAIKAALQILANGGTVDEAKTICQPDVLNHLIKSNKKLKVYLAPFLHAMRSTLFGRHFSNVEKLQEIVDMLQWYVQNGDMIVDFCCGANDFSRLMKENLDASGKRCSFKNYDVVQPKHDLNFERKDWMKLQPEELSTGSRLIIGLTPPFGVDAALANNFIDKALTFKPKLLILIVPRETQRLDKKQPPYDLIWKRRLHLSGEDMRIEQWDLKPPLLYLWSRPDWTTKHRAIALKRDHIREKAPAQEETREMRLDIHPPEERISEKHENNDAITPEETTREGSNLKIAEEEKQRMPLENYCPSFSKKRRAKRKERDEGKRTEPEAVDRVKEDESSHVHVLPPDRRNSGFIF